MTGTNVNHRQSGRRGLACTVILPAGVPLLPHQTSVERAMRAFRNAALLQRRQHQNEIEGRLIYDGQTKAAYILRLGKFGGVTKEPVPC